MLRRDLADTIQIHLDNSCPFGRMASALKKNCADAILPKGHVLLGSPLNRAPCVIVR